MVYLIYLANNLLYRLQAYALNVLWAAGIQQEHCLVSSLRS